MVNNRQWIGGLVGFGLVFVSGSVIAMPEAHQEISGTASSQGIERQLERQLDHRFERIEQPLGIKLGVNAAGIGLIGLELWWFLLSKSQNTRA